jgi:serine/threonine protein phosphatase PrpC
VVFTVSEAVDGRPATSCAEYQGEAVVMGELRHEIPLPDGTISFRFAGHSDRGAVRRLNEDSFLATMPLFLVADGMGGHSFGDRASQAAVGAFSSVFDEQPASPRVVLETIRRANEAVLAVSENSETPDAISGTTLAGVAFVTIGVGEGHHWMAFNIGESRIYSWDGRTLSQLSVDHSAVQELVDLGQITRNEAERHPDRNIVTRALGADLEVDADIWLVPVRRSCTTTRSPASSCFITQKRSAAPTDCR